MNNYTVYMHISPSGKRYIGITCKKKPEYRWNDGKGYKGNEHFYRAIKKYGWDNFQHIIIAKGLSEDEAKWLEIELIREWDTTNRSKGYNITKGGEGTKGWVPSDETRRKISEANKGKNNYWYGKHHSEETKKKMSKASKGKSKSEEHKKKLSEANKGQKHTQERRKKIREACSGKNNPNSKSVICLTTNAIFYTSKEGAEYYNCTRSHIISCCKGNRKSCGKLPDGTKLVWMYLEEFLNKCNYIIL